jgi:hypothetical protein
MAGSGWSPNGVNSVQAYQPPAVPWVTGSLAIGSGNAQRIGFPNVSKYFRIKNTGANSCKVGFTQAGTEGDKWFSVSSGTSETFDLRVRDIWLQGDGGSTTVDVLGGMTAIPRRFYQPLTGANPPPSGSWYVPGIE